MAASENPLVIPLFIPHYGCPHQCVFCNQSLITGQDQKIPDQSSILQTIDAYLQYRGKRTQVEAAFFGGNFLGLSDHEIRQMLETVQPYIKDGRINSIRFSTRPDTVTPDRLEMIRPYGVSMVELGAQSMNDKVLSASNRGHTSQDTVSAVNMLKAYGYGVGLQIMVGLPHDTPESLTKSTIEAAGLKPDIVRIYPLLVMAGSPLENLWRKGLYQPMDLDESVELVKEMVNIFTRCQIPVVRTGLQASDLMADEKCVLAGPWHPAFGHLVFSGLMYDQMVAQIQQDPGLKTAQNIFIRVHPASESRARGDKNENLKKLRQKFGCRQITIIKDERLDRSQIKVAADHEIF